MINMIQEEGDRIDLTAPYARDAGQGALVGALFGIAINDVANGAVGAFQVEGIFDITKKSGDTPAQGALVYWDDTNKYVTTTSSGNTLIGHAVAAAGSSDPTVRVRIRP